MKRRFASTGLVALTLFLSGCATDGSRRGRGDLGAFILQEATEYGAQPAAVTLPPSLPKSGWRYRRDEMGIVIDAPTTASAGLDSFLGQAFGTPRMSNPEGPTRIWKSSGVAVTLSTDEKEAQVILVRSLFSADRKKAIKNLVRTVEAIQTAEQIRNEKAGAATPAGRGNR